MDLQNLGARLTALREARGLTKYRMAKLSGVSQTYIYRIEKGEIENPRHDTLQKLAAGLNIALAQLIGDTAPIDTWQLVEQSLKAYIPVYSGIYEVGMEPIDYVVCTRAKVPPDTLRGYRIAGLSLKPEIREGDTIIVDTVLSPSDGDLVVVLEEKPKGGSRMVALKRFSEDGDGSKHIEGNEGRCDLDDKGCCSIHHMCVYGVIREYVRTLK